MQLSMSKHIEIGFGKNPHASYPGLMLFINNGPYYKLEVSGSLFKYGWFIGLWRRLYAHIVV